MAEHGFYKVLGELADTNTRWSRGIHRWILSSGLEGKLEISIRQHGLNWVYGPLKWFCGPEKNETAYASLSRGNWTGCIRMQKIVRVSMATQAATTFKGNMKKALAELGRINLEGMCWRVFDAKGLLLGRLASQIATVVQGKDKPTYALNRDDGDMCIVLNAKDEYVTGWKLTDKFYRWHTGYVGHLTERSLKDYLAEDLTEVIRKAVLRMLPRNKLRDGRDRKLRIFAGSEHPFGDRSLQPYVMPPRNVREMRPRARRAMIRAQKKAEQQQNTGETKGKRREVSGSESLNR